MSKNPILQTMIELVGRDNVITIHKSVVEFTGSLETAMLLEQLLYWTPRSANDGWIAKSDEEFQKELSLSRYSIRNARHKLEDMKILETDVRRFNGSPTVHYKINAENLSKRWLIWNQTLDRLNSDDTSSEIIRSLTEITTEITTETPRAENFEKFVPSFLSFVEEEVTEEPKTPPLSHAPSSPPVEEIAAEAILGTDIVARRERIRQNAPELKRAGANVDIFAASRQEGPDLSMYPIDIVDEVRVIIHLFLLSAPTGGPKLADWIRGARDLKQACGGSDKFTREVLLEYSDNWRADMIDPKREALTISRPGSLVEPCRALAGRMRMASTYAGAKRPKTLKELKDYLNSLDDKSRHAARLNMGFAFDPDRGVYTPPFSVDYSENPDGDLHWFDSSKNRKWEIGQRQGYPR